VETVRRRLSIGVFPLLAALFLANAARAEGSASPASGSQPSEPEKRRHETYRRLKMLGNEALREGRFEEALPLFLTAWSSWEKDGSLACDIGRLYLRRGEPVPATLWLTRGVALLSDASTPEAVRRRRAEVVDLAVARARVTTLHVETEPGAVLSIDGVDIGTSPQAEPAFVEPGQHRVEARKGERLATAVIDGKAGETRRVPLVLLPAEPPPFERPDPKAAPVLALPSLPPPALPAPQRPAPQFVWWPVYLGTTLAVTGITSGIMLRIAADNASTKLLALEEQIMEEKPGVVCGSHTSWHPRCLEYVRLDVQYVGYADTSTAAFIVAGVAAAGAIGFAAYEVDRVSLAPTIGGFVGTFRW